MKLFYQFSLTVNNNQLTQHVPGLVRNHSFHDCYMHCFIYDKSTKQFNLISKAFNSINIIEPNIEWLLEHLIECKQNRLLVACF